MRLYCAITEKLGKIRSFFEKHLRQERDEKIEYRRISSSKIKELDVKTIEYLLSEGNRYIDNQNQTGKELRSKSLALLGILSTILISLIGLCILMIDEGQWYSVLFYFVLYGIMATGTVSFRLFVAVVYERSYKISGEKPTYILSEEAYNYASKKEDLHKYLLGQQLVLALIKPKGTK
ncbi:MAG: hypothetical protein IKW32_04560 [Bacteroidaceae bacterium]|nr:hypothetical protein [Bacteroidaceae bacterium]